MGPLKYTSTRASLVILLLAAGGDSSPLLPTSRNVRPFRSNAIFRLRGGYDQAEEAMATIVDDSSRTSPQEAEGHSLRVETSAKDDEPIADASAKTGKKTLVRNVMNTMRSNVAKAWQKDFPLQSLKSKLQELKDRRSWSSNGGTTRLAMSLILHICSRDRPLKPLSVIILTLTGSSLGFYSFLYFATLGYCVSISLATMAGLIAYNILPKNRIPALCNVHTGLTFLWSIRLAMFLLHREFINWPAWHEKTREVNEKSRESKTAVWITCGSFYAAMASPCIYRLQAGADASPGAKWGIIGITGIALQCIGLVLESVSDAQKAGFKATAGNRHSWCNVGLWSHFTHPNYLGEVLFWIGTYLGGVGCYTEKYQWTISTLGLLFVMFVMRVANEALSAQELRRYGLNESYMEFRNSHSFLGPFRLSRQIHL